MAWDSEYQVARDPTVRDRPITRISNNANLRFYPAAPVVPFQGNTGLGIGFAAGPARALDEDDGCGVGADPVAGTAAEEFSCHCL